MADKTAPQANEADNDTLQTSPKNPSKSTENEVGEGRSDPRRGIFAERFHTMTDAFGEACEQQKVETAIAIAMHPEENVPIIFLKGHEYDVAALLARVLRNLKGKILSDLDV